MPYDLFFFFSSSLIAHTPTLFSPRRRRYVIISLLRCCFRFYDAAFLPRHRLCCCHAATLMMLAAVDTPPPLLMLLDCRDGAPYADAALCAVTLLTKSSVCYILRRARMIACCSCAICRYYVADASAMPAQIPCRCLPFTPDHLPSPLMPDFHAIVIRYARMRRRFS